MAVFTFGTLVNQKQTTLNGAMTAISPANGENLPVTLGTVFPTKGYALVDQEVVHYDSVSGNNLVLNATDGRGSLDTSATAHDTLAPIYADVIVSAHFNELMAYSPNNILTAKGDVLTASAASTPTRRAVGSDGYYLTANSSEPSGLNYTAPPGIAGTTPIVDVTVSASSSLVDLGVIPITYKHLKIIVSARSASAVATDALAIQMNGDGGNNYDSMDVDIKHSASIITTEHLAKGSGVIGNIPGASASNSHFGGLVVNLPDYANASVFKPFHASGAYATAPLTTKLHACISEGMWKSTAKVSGIKVSLTNGDNIEVGSRFTVYGEV